MLKLFVVLFGVWFSTSALAQQMLVLRPPVYQSGESSKGLYVGKNGLQMQLLQTALFGPDKKVYVLMSLIDLGGVTRGHLLFDPRTWRAQVITETESSKTLSSTCSPDGLYPITLGKSYECSSSFQINDKVSNSRSKTTFDKVETDKDGRVTSFCSLNEEEDDDFKITARLCLSPDGKWARSVTVLEVVVIKKS